MEVVRSTKNAAQYLDKALSLDPNYEPAQINRENINRMKEWEKRRLYLDCLWETRPRGMDC